MSTPPDDLQPVPDPKDRPIRVAILASGGGTTAQTLLDRFARHPIIGVVGVISNRPSAGALDRARTVGIPAHTITRDDMLPEGGLEKLLTGPLKANALVMAGFLWLLPASVIRAMEGRVVNLHPALLPRHGGAGMYGARVHEAVAQARDSETGITLHWADEQYDRGPVIEQHRIAVPEGATAGQIEGLVRELEQRYFAAALERWLLTLPLLPTQPPVSTQN